MLGAAGIEAYLAATRLGAKRTMILCPRCGETFRAGTKGASHWGSDYCKVVATRRRIRREGLRRVNGNFGRLLRDAGVAVSEELVRLETDWQVTLPGQKPDPNAKPNYKNVVAAIGLVAPEAPARLVTGTAGCPRRQRVEALTIVDSDPAALDLWISIRRLEETNHANHAKPALLSFLKAYKA